MRLNADVPPTSEGACLLLGRSTFPSAFRIEGLVLVRENRAAAPLSALSLLRQHEEANRASSRLLQVLLEHVVVSLEKSIDFSLGLDLLPHFQSYLRLAIPIVASKHDPASISIVRHIAKW